MYATITFFIVVFFATLVVLTPYRLADHFDTVLRKLRNFLFSRSSQNVFDSQGKREKQIVKYVQLWSLVSVIVFVVLGIQHGAFIQNAPGAVQNVILNAIAAVGSGLMVVFAVMARTWFVTDAKACVSLGQCGIRSLWLVGTQSKHNNFCEEMTRRVRTSESVSIVDVTGYEFIGRGPRASGGLLYDVLALTPKIPVSVLLMKPMSEEVDPERQQATVFQTVLHELGITKDTYKKRLHATLKMIEQLNTNRLPEARIRVSFYTEKPSVRGILFDDSILTAPWQTREGQGPLPLLEIARKSVVPSFYETFRLQHARLWSQKLGKVFVPVGETRQRAASAVA